MRLTFAKILPIFLIFGQAPLAARAEAESNRTVATLTYDEARNMREAEERAAWRLRVEAARQRYETFAAQAESTYRAQRGSQFASTSSSGAAGPLAAALADPTLRYNDMVVAADHVLIFRGAEGERHSPADFERLSETNMRALSLRTVGNDY